MIRAVWLCLKERRSLAAAGHCELPRCFEQLLHRFLRAGLGVYPQQRLGSRCPQEQPGFRGVRFGFRFGIVEPELDAVEGFDFFDRHSGELLHAGFRSCDCRVLQVIGDMQVDAAILMLAVFLLETLDQLAEGLLLLGHDVGDEQRIQQAIALRQMAADSDAAGLLAADQDVFGEHQVADKLEANAMLVQLASVTRGDTVEHRRCVECAGHAAGPAFALQNPLQDDRVDFVRIDEIAVLVGGSNAVRIAIGDQAGVAFLRDDHVLAGADVGLDGLRIDAGKQRIGVGANLDVVDADPGEDAGKDARAGAIHAIDGELESRLCDQIQIDEPLDSIEVGGDEIDLLDFRGLDRGKWLAEQAFDLRHDGRAARAAVGRFVFHAIPLRRIVAGGDHDATGRCHLLNGERQRRCGRDAVRQLHRYAGAGEHFRYGSGECGRAEARVVANADAFRGVFSRQDIAGDGGGGGAHIIEREVVGDDASPPVGAEFYWGLLGHSIEVESEKIDQMSFSSPRAASSFTTLPTSWE